MNNNGVPDGILVIESVYSGNQWLASRNTADLDLTNAPTVGGGGGPQWHVYAMVKRVP